MGTIETNVSEALKDPDARAFATTQIDALRASAADAEASVISFGRSILILALAFMLISESANKDVEVFGFTFADIGLVLKLLPALIALLYYRMLTQAIRTDCLMAAYRELTRHLYPRYFQYDLDVLGYPAAFAPEYLLAQHTQGKTYRFFLIASAPTGLVFTIGPLLFLVYAYWHCLRRFGPSDLAVLVSLALTVLLLLQSLVYKVGARGLTDF